MKKISTKYLHEATGITFEVEFKDGKKHITVRTQHDDDEFIFKNSKAETLIKIGQALLSIGNFCAKIRTDGVCEHSYNIGTTTKDPNSMKGLYF